MHEEPALDFDSPDLLGRLDALTDSELDTLDFGVIGFDDQGIVQRYNECESKAAGLSKSRLIGQSLFMVVAPCMNNFLVAQRFDDAKAEGVALDATIPFVLTFRMRPTKIRLRMMSAPGGRHRYVLITRLA